MIGGDGGVDGVAPTTALATSAMNSVLLGIVARCTG